MNIFVVCSNYFETGCFGTYSTLKRARTAIEHFFKNNPEIASFEDIGDYTYEIHTKNGETFGVEIAFDSLDYEFMTGELEEDE